MTQPQPMATPVPQISWVVGTPQFVRLSDIYAVPGIDMFEVTCITDAPCMLQLAWERTNPPADPGGVPLTGTVEDIGPTTNHRLSVPAGSIAQQPRQQIAQEVRFEIGLSPTDSSLDAQGVPRELREYVSTLKLRQQPWNFVPVKFYEFGGTPPPLPGGDEADWNTYAWAQYNPNGQPRVDLDLPFLDILARNGGPPFGDTPAVRLWVRAGVSGSIGIEFSTPLPDSASTIPEVPFTHATALLHVFVDGHLRERFAWKIPQPGELEAVEALIRGVAESQIIRPARLVVNPSSVERQTFLGPNYWLVSTAGAQPSLMRLARDQQPAQVQADVA
jgi:hypothetical protein